MRTGKPRGSSGRTEREESVRAQEVHRHPEQRYTYSEGAHRWSRVERDWGQ